MSFDSFLAVIGPDADRVTGTSVTGVPGQAIAVRGARAACVSDDERALAFVGRLDNSRELAERLDIPDRVDGESATEAAARIVFASYRVWGGGFLDRVIGGFAGAFIDHRRHEVRVFRDLTAGQAAYLTTTHEGSVVCGSDLAEVASWRQSMVPSDLFVAGYLQNLWLEPSATAYDQVFAVIPGHIATINRGERAWRQKRYADWHVQHIRRESFDDYVDEFASHLDEAVRCRLEGASQVSIRLSGGLDSTNVLASLVRVAPAQTRVSAYAIPFRTPRGDERARQIAAARHCDVPLTWISVDGRGPFGKWSGQLFAGRPVAPLGGNWYFGDSVYERAAADGVEVLYDGEDADSLLSGNRSYLADMLARGQFRAWLRETTRISRSEDTTVSRLLRYSLYKQIPNLVLAVFGRRTMVVAPSPLLAADLARRVGLERRLRTMPAARVWHPGRRFQQYLKLAGGAHHLGMVVPELAIAARGTGVEPAHPFFDRRLMTFCMGLPWHVVCGGSMPKRPLRMLARQRLPAVFHQVQTKAVLDEYYDAAVYGHENDLVLKGLRMALDRPDWVDPAEVQELIDDVRQKKSSFMPSRVAMLMFWDQQLRSGSGTGMVPV